MGTTYCLDILASKMVGHGLCDRRLFSHTKYLGDHTGDGGLTQAFFFPSFSLIQFSRLWCKCHLMLKLKSSTAGFLRQAVAWRRHGPSRAFLPFSSSLFTLSLSISNHKPTIELHSTPSRVRLFLSTCTNIIFDR
jgi:hypothetical protein